MATSGKGSGIVGYNVQSVLDTMRRLIVVHDVTNVGANRGQLSNMAGQARMEIGTATLDAMADHGYCDGQQILACETVGITVTLAAAADVERQGRGSLRQAGASVRDHQGVDGRHPLPDEKIADDVAPFFPPLERTPRIS